MELEGDATTKWQNKTNHHFSFLVHLGPGQRRRVKIAPGQVIDLPSDWDNAIQFKNKGSDAITGGLCPQLTRVGDDTSVVDPVLLGIERKPAAPAAPPAAAAPDQAAALRAENAELHERLSRLERLLVKQPEPAAEQAAPEKPAAAAKPARQGQGPRPTEAAT